MDFLGDENLLRISEKLMIKFNAHLSLSIVEFV
jgi:hypothetical protein